MRTLRGRLLLRASEVAVRRGHRRMYYRLVIAAVDHENGWRRRRGWQPIFISDDARAFAKGKAPLDMRAQKQTTEAA